MDSHKRLTAGTLTFRSNDGYVLTAPVDFFEVHTEEDYSGVDINRLLDSAYINTPLETTFTARLGYGQTYTVQDVGVEVERTLAVKGNVTKDFDLRIRLDVPANAKARYLEKNDLTKFTWKERVVVD